MSGKGKKGSREVKKTQVDENQLRKEMRNPTKSKEKSENDKTNSVPIETVDISSKPLDEIRLGGVEG